MSTYDIDADADADADTDADADADADARDGMVSSPGATFQDAKSRLALGDTKPLSHGWDLEKIPFMGCCKPDFLLTKRFTFRNFS